MTDLRDKLLTLDREGLEQEAARLGISVTESMSRAKLIIAIETANAHRELESIQSFWEYRALIFGVLLITIASIVWVVDTYLLLTGLQVLFLVVPLSLIPSLIYWVLRALGGCLIVAALISLGFKKGDERVTPIVRGALIILAILIILIVIVSIPVPGTWFTMYP